MTHPPTSMSNNDINDSDPPTCTNYEETWPSVPSFCDVRSSEGNRNDSFKTGEFVKLWNGSMKKVLHVNKNRKIAQISGFRWWFPFSQLNKYTAP